MCTTNAPSPYCTNFTSGHYRPPCRVIHRGLTAWVFGRWSEPLNTRWCR